MASACGGSLALMDAGTKYGTYKDKLRMLMCTGFGNDQSL